MHGEQGCAPPSLFLSFSCHALREARPWLACRAAPTVRCKTEIARAGLDGPRNATQSSRPAAMIYTLYNLARCPPSPGINLQYLAIVRTQERVLLYTKVCCRVSLSTISHPTRLPEPPATPPTCPLRSISLPKQFSRGSPNHPSSPGKVSESPCPQTSGRCKKRTALYHRAPVPDTRH